MTIVNIILFVLTLVDTILYFLFRNTMSSSHLILFDCAFIVLIIANIVTSLIQIRRRKK